MKKSDKPAARGVDAALERYRAKRDLRASPEPAGEPPARRAAGAAFVVQKHAARRLHYDFRLELDGTLKSWAVPKGPSLDPKDKRMAVQVEDHPLAYAGFEGRIPAGHYGAGTVIVWDRGRWEPHGDARAGYRAGKLKFALHGHKLRGDWTLVRLHGREDERQPPWLLIKERDGEARSAAEFDLVAARPDSVSALAPGPAAAPAEAPRRTTRRRTPALPAGARPAALPATLAPQLATLATAQPREPGWIYEVKFDGYRLLARIERGAVRLMTRNGHDWTVRMPALARALAGLGLPDAWLDGEIVVPGADGAPDFQALQNAFDGGRGLDALRYYLFDLPWYAGHDLRAVPLAERRALLAATLAAADPPAEIRYSEAFDAPAGDLLDAACRLQLEGLIGKRADSRYASGRSGAWIKLKCGRRQEFVIGGWTDPQGARSGFGALLLGVAEDDGSLRYVGNVGTGFDQATLRALHAQLAPLARASSPFAARIAGQRGVHWVEPRLVAEVAFGAWTAEGRVRHAVFKGLREDKPARQVRREQAQPVPAGKPPVKVTSRTSRGAAEGVRITHAERVVDAASGHTKGELVAYYERVAPLLLPYLKDRPVALLRAPEGVGRPGFFQKHADARQLPGVRLLDPALDSGGQPLLAIDTAAALLGAAQMNAIELHTWNATARAIETPDRMVFDLDPGEGVAWPQMLEAARIVHELLDALGLRSWLKTSGGKGLHVVVPLARRHGWDTVKGYSQAVVAHLARHASARFVAKSGPRNRVGRIFVDYLRNGRGATTAAAFAVRARPGLPISLPLDWSELPGLAPPPQATIATPLARLETAAQAWQTMATTRQGLGRAMKTLGYAP